MDYVIRFFDLRPDLLPMHSVVYVRIAFVLENFWVYMWHSHTLPKNVSKNELLTGKGSFLVIR